jgi:hypothetical protein
MDIRKGSETTDTTPAGFLAAERAEFETVAADLLRAHRLSKLLRYLGEKYFSGCAHHLTEFNIATEVLGRSKTSFATSQDAIARVEAHRLRKWLKTYYETKGKDHPIRIVLPAGTYVPVFEHRDAEGNRPLNTTDATGAAAHPPHAVGPAGPSTVKPTWEDGEATESQPHEKRSSAPALPDPKEPRTQAALQQPRFLQPRFLAPLFFLLALGIGLRLHFGHPMYPTRSAAQVPAPVVPSIPAHRGVGVGVSVPFRIICGYQGPPQMDSAGDLWRPDEYWVNGWTKTQPAVFIARTSDPFLFHYGRFGDFSYKIPLAPGTYELHLYFISAAPTPEPEEDQDKSVFTVTINGKNVFGDFDPLSDAMGINIADERVLRDISPAPDGFLHIQLSTYVGSPSLSALKILPGLPHKQLPTRIITRATPWMDPHGQLWHPDTYYLGGRRLTHNDVASGETNPGTDAPLYNTERYGHFSYAIPADPRDQYTVILHFAELHFGSNGPEGGGVGSRVFRVIGSGETLLDNFDISREAAPGQPVVKTFYHLKPTAQGKLNLDFEPIRNYATVSGIEVLDESH